MVRFQTIAEPKEAAFTILMPAGWRVAGGITRVDPAASGGALNAIGARLDLSMTSGDGRIALHWYPETNYFDMRGSPAQGMFPPGSNYNGAPVWPKLNAAAYLQQIVFRRAHPGAEGVYTAVQDWDPAGAGLWTNKIPFRRGRPQASWIRPDAWCRSS